MKKDSYMLINKDSVESHSVSFYDHASNGAPITYRLPTLVIKPHFLNISIAFIRQLFTK